MIVSADFGRLPGRAGHKGPSLDAPGMPTWYDGLERVIVSGPLPGGVGAQVSLE